MASVVRLGGEKSKNRAVDFKNHLGKRRRIYLGYDYDHDQAEEIARQIQKIVNAKRINLPLERLTVAWLEDVANDLFEKLVKEALVEQRPRSKAAPKLSAWLTKYVDQRRGELEKASIEKFERAGASLKEFFTADPRINEITPEDAADWRAWLAAMPKTNQRTNKIEVDPETGNPIPKFSETTIRNYSKDVKTIFNAAVDQELIEKNPFKKLKSAVLSVQKDNYLGLKETADVLAECHTTGWKVLFGLARFAGLRTPSETHRLTWANVNWERRLLSVYAPKTKRTRLVPITADLFEILQTAFDEAEEGAVKILDSSKHGSNLHRGLERIIVRAGVPTWDDMFNTLRASAEIDFARKYPQHEVSRWIGHSMKVSEKHYLAGDGTSVAAATSAPPLLPCSKSVVEPRRIGRKSPETMANSGGSSREKTARKSEETPVFAEVSSISEKGTRTPDPRLMKPVL